MPHLLTLEPVSGETRVTLHTAGSLVATHIVHAGTLESLITRADALLSRSGDQYPTRYDLLAFGRELADCLLGPATLPALLALRGRLWIVSPDPDLLNLPLELIPRDPASFLIEGGHLLLRRTAEPSAATAAADAVTRPGPLRVLFMACSPQDENRLAFEKEEESMVKISLRAGKIAHVEIAESGSFAELEEKVASYRPHIVHLSGHAALEDGVGYFCFEDERGLLDLRSSEDITDLIFANSGVAMVFLSGCETARSGLAGLCQDLVSSGHVPLALGWGMPVCDNLATLFAASLFKRLDTRHGVDAAIDHARTELLAACPMADPHGNECLLADFALPRLYAAVPTDHLYDHNLSDPPPRPTFRPTMLADNIVGLKEGFVGRRRILQHTLPVLRDADEGKTILLLTGIGGAGKSTLAIRLANRHEHGGLKVVALRHRENETPELFAIRLLQEIQVASLASGNPHPLTPVLTGDAYELPVRMRFAIEVLNALPLLLVLDNLETLMPLPPAPPAWQHSAFGIFFTELNQRLTGESRALLTCRYVPAGFDLPPTVEPSPVLHLGMPDFAEADFFKCAEYHEDVADRLANRVISRHLLAEFCRKLGATPRFVKQALPVLAELSAQEITAVLATIGEEAATDADGETDNPIRNLQQEYFADLFLPGLYQALAPAHRLALSRLAVSDFALPLDGAAAVMALSEDEARDALDACLRLGLLQCFDDREGPPLFSIYPLQRNFLTSVERLPASEKPATHLALAQWLQACSRADREPEFGLNSMAVFGSCLSHAMAAEEYDLAGWAATRIGIQLHGKSEFRTLLELARDWMAQHRHPDFLKLAADALESLGEWPEAGTLLIEAAPGFDAIGNRVAEAATWAQLSMLLYTQTGSSRASLHLAAVAWLILKSIGSADQKTAFNNLAARASDLSLTEEVLGEEIQTALASYQSDGGAALLAAAFPNAEDA